jgi:hypothetical protein
MITGERDILLLDNDEPMTYAEAMMAQIREMAKSHEIRNRFYG